MMRYTKGTCALLLAAVLAACGGGGGSPGATPGGDTSGGGTTTTPGGTTTTPATPAVAGLIYELSKPTLTNAGTDTVSLTVTALDAKNNPVANVPLTVAIDSGVYTPKNATTGANGQAGGDITIGGNKANRNITATITMGGQTSTAVIAVVGSTITLTPVPTTVAPGGSTRVDVKVVDSAGVGIPNASVRLSGTLGFNSTVTTDPTGSASATLAAAPAASGSYTIDATALGVTSTRTVQVVGGAAGGVIPDAVGVISSASLSIVPTTIAPNTAGSTTNKAALRAKFVTAANQAVQNVRVRFEIGGNALGAGEQISTGAATVYSDANGEALSEYIAGTRSSPTNGVTIRACYGPTDASIANGACPNSVTQTLTVANQPLSISIGDNNKMEKANSELTYVKKFDVAVVDAAGNAVSGAQISASVDITQYQKGPFAGPRVTCNNEDTNRNGFLDTGEDVNGNGTLEPRKADIALSFVSGNTTDATGRMVIQVQYPQNVATWLFYTVKVTTNVAGSEGTVQKSFQTNALQEDAANGSFLTPPYGTGACTSPN